MAVGEPLEHVPGVIKLHTPTVTEPSGLFLVQTHWPHTQPQRQSDSYIRVGPPELIHVYSLDPSGLEGGLFPQVEMQ